MLTSLLLGLGCGVLPADIIEGTDGGTATTTTATPTTTTGPTTTAGSLSDTTMGTASSSGTDDGVSSSDTDPCPPGTEGCPCDSNSCMEGLVCFEDQCIIDQCGNGRLDPPEACDDGNEVEHDGCTQGCTFSPRARAVAAGGQHTCAVFHDGQLMCWGLAAQGQLGYGNTSNIGDFEPPVSAGFVDVGGSVSQVDLGSDHGCVLRSDDQVLCWGRNQNDGALGQGTELLPGEHIGDDEVPSTYYPVDLGMSVKAISVGARHACAIRDDDQAICWGYGVFGRLGYGNQDNVGHDASPVAAGVVQTGADVLQIAAGGSHTCALLEGNQIRCWGAGSSGQLGYGNTENVGDGELPMDRGPVMLGPGEVPVLVRTGGNHTCVLLEDNGIRCWGAGSVGQLGYGTNSNLGDVSPITDESPITMAGGVQIVDLALGDAHTCAVTAAGGVYCWGEGEFGRLGKNSSDDLNSPPPSPVFLGPGRQATQVTAGTEHTCVRLTQSDVMCWGNGNNGKLGYGMGGGNIGDTEHPAMFNTVPIE